jgi:HD-like signal output (HDOD) protein
MKSCPLLVVCGLGEPVRNQHDVSFIDRVRSLIARSLRSTSIGSSVLMPLIFFIDISHCAGKVYSWTSCISLEGDHMYCNNPDTSTLKRLRPLSHFTEEYLRPLANQLQLKTARKKEKLIERGCADDYSLFVIEGEVTLKASDGKVQELSINRKQELTPLAQLRPCMYDVLAESELKYLKIDKHLLIQFSQQMEQGSEREDISVHIFEGNADTNSLTMHLYQDLLEDKITLPSLPEATQKIHQVFHSGDVNAKAMAKVLLTDPAMTGKLIRVANCSSLYHSVGALDTLPAVLTRLSMDTVYDLVMSGAMNELFESYSEHVAKLMRQISKHSQKVAAISRILAERSKKFDPEQAMLAGLVHNLSTIVILHYIDLHNEKLPDDQQLEQTITTLRPQITGMLMQKWNFTEEIIRVAEECENWFRNPGREADLCDLVMVAHYHSLLGTPKMKFLPSINSLPAMAKLQMGPAESIELLKQSRAKSAEIERALQ